MKNNNKQKMDTLTGNTYEGELNMYMRYHGLTLEQATLVMSAQTFKERDKIFNDIIAG